MRNVQVFSGVLLLVFGSFAVQGAGGGPEKRDLAGGGHYVLVLPSGYDAAKKYDLIVALHGAGDTAENFARFWTGHAGKRGSILAVPEASSQMGPGFTWNGNDIDRIVATVGDVAKSFSADPRRVLLTGHSAGCAMGFMVLEAKADHFTCFGGTAHGLTPRHAMDKLKEAAKTTAIYYSVGTKDPNYAIYESTVKQLTEAKFFLKSEAPEIGHTIVPEQVEHMLAHFDAACDQAGAEKLAAAKKLLEGKHWAQAETALAEAGVGFGAAAQEAKTLLDSLQKDLQAKFEAAKSQTGPEAVAALKAFAKEFAGTKSAQEAEALAAQVASDPKTVDALRDRKQQARNEEAVKALADAGALEKAGKLPLALDAYRRIAREYADTPVKTPAEAAAARMEKDPKVNEAQAKAEAERLFKRAENYQRNSANEMAKKIYLEIADKFPGTEAAREAKERAGKL
ncbi:MAG: hypothetical protein M5U26_28765 [Planctomycetota bacterium]|nr:hypothetical protein [Planctomycetota bacterium]